MKLILWLYLKLIRVWLSPLLYWIFRYTIYREIFINKWDKINKFDKYEFGTELLNYPYKSDFLWGLIDFSPRQKNFFFLERNHNRDCDDWARMWYWWGIENGYPVWEVAIVDGFKIWTSHKITIIKINNKYAVMDYFYRDSFDTLEEAIESRKQNGRYNNLVWQVNKKGENKYEKENRK